MNYEGFNILIERKRIKNMYARVVDEHTLLVTCPKRIKDNEVYDFIVSNIDKIRKNIIKTQKKLETSKLYRGGDFFYVFGEKKEINSNTNISQLYKALNNRLLEIAKVYLDKYSNMLKDYGYYQEPILKIRKMSSKWGVCYTSKNTICLSTYLVHYPYECIEYIMLHEMCHFIVPNHSKRFYSLIERRLPRYKEISKQLY